jgi:hypothetical protein
MTHQHRRALHGMAAAVTVFALAAPAASAAPVEQFFPRGEDESAGGSPSVPPSSMAASAAQEYDNLRSPNATTVPVRVVKVPADGGFDWGDAGIGATGALALTALGTGAAFALGHGPARRRHVPQAIR